MNQYTRLITLAGGILVLFSFAFPWAEDLTGVELANVTSHTSNVGYVSLIFVASLIIIFTSIVGIALKETFYKLFILLGSIIGLICFVVMFFTERLEIRLYGQIIDETHYGAFLSAIGFIIAMFSLTISPKKKD